ncbi:hypothetical protein Clacol_009292 [Clathrus columnatus]|uniref:non-specific serine/threonine protein kinase n=1 Tax=Clathrus columnatus TaxID=1419009 RepID=A0AAV5APD4_9AGAM|nr:hypothetical protein Clacol_009292 [Clathrus columnatus]
MALLSFEDHKYFAAKILSLGATESLKHGSSHELEVLNAVAARRRFGLLPILYDHFAQEGPCGVHYVFLTATFCSDVSTFRASAPTGRLGIHIVKPIVACVVEGLQALHSLNIVHADIKSDNILFLGPDTTDIEEEIARDPPSVEGVLTLDGTQYPILRSQPFQPLFSWDVAPHIAETITVILSDFGAAFRADGPKPFTDIGVFALRAPENIIRAECGKEIDIWAVGCLTYELLTGENLFQPQTIPNLTLDESLLLLQFSVTGEILSKDVVNQSRVRDKFFNREGRFIQSRANIYPSQSIKERLTERCNGDLTERQINAAARFISDCLRLNPRDRPTVDELGLHPWLETAFRGGTDLSTEPTTTPTPVPPSFIRPTPISPTVIPPAFILPPFVPPPFVPSLEPTREGRRRCTTVGFEGLDRVPIRQCDEEDAEIHSRYRSYITTIRSMSKSG